MSGSSSSRCTRSCNWCDNARPSVDLPAPHTPVMHLSETGERRHGPPAPTTRVLPRRRSGRLWASLPSAEYYTTARPTLWADGRFPGETWPCPPGPGPCRLGPSPTVLCLAIYPGSWPRFVKRGGLEVRSYWIPGSYAPSIVREAQLL